MGVLGRNAIPFVGNPNDSAAKALSLSLVVAGNKQIRRLVVGLTAAPPLTPPLRLSFRV